MVNTNYCHISDNDFLLDVFDPPAFLAAELQPLQRLLRHDGEPVCTCESLLIALPGPSLKSVWNNNDSDGHGNSDGDGDGNGDGDGDGDGDNDNE